jgi:hypothetical protein
MAWDENNMVADYSHYLKGYIKADGCSHLWFGDENGYLHFYGRSDFEKHKNVLDAIWDICTKKIERWNNDIAS